MQPCFRRAVDRSDWQRHESQSGGDIHDGGGRLAQQVWQELLHHAYGPNKISFNLAADILEIAPGSAHKQVGFAHDSRIVEQHIQPGKFSDHGIAKKSNRLGIGNVALKRPDSGKLSLRFLDLALISPGNDHDITKLEKLGG